MKSFCIALLTDITLQEFSISTLNSIHEFITLFINYSLIFQTLILIVFVSKISHHLIDIIPIYLFNPIGLQRYNLLPHGSQEIFSRVILEPLLSIGVGLFLYRIRSCPILYPISTGLLPLQSISDKSVRSSHFSNGSTNGSRNSLLELTVPRELVEFKASVEYFQSCLENIPKGSRGFSGSVTRYQESWKAARGDFPDDLIKDRLKDDGYSVVDVIKNIMFLSYPGDSDDLKEKEKERERERQASAEVAGPDDSSIGGVVDYARTQVLKMSSVLETQWAKLQ